MAEDIVTQLEWLHGEFYDVDSVTSIVELAKAEIERLRAAGDALAATWPEEERCGCNNSDCRAVVAAYDAWQEARREQ